MVLHLSNVALCISFVSFHVRSQVAGLGERLTARLADKRLLPRMCPHVRSQAVGLRERLAARLADKRLLPRMCPHVFSQVAGQRKRLATRTPRT